MKSHQFITGHTYRNKIITHSHTYGQFKVTKSPNVLVFGLWQRIQGTQNELTQTQNMQTTHRKALTQPGIEARRLC